MTVSIRLLASIARDPSRGMLFNLLIQGDGNARHWDEINRLGAGLLRQCMTGRRRVRETDVTLRWLVNIEDDEFLGMLGNLEVTGNGSPAHWSDTFSVVRHQCAQRLADTWICEKNEGLRWHGWPAMLETVTLAREFCEKHAINNETWRPHVLTVPSTGPVVMDVDAGPRTLPVRPVAKGSGAPS